MSVNAKFDAANHYYSGQGVVMIGTRNPVTGAPIRLLPLGNVKDLKISIASSVIDHKGSQDGQRAIDKRLQTETKCTATVQIENWIAANLATALRGGSQVVAGGTVVADTYPAYGGAVVGLPHIGISAFTLKVGATSLVEYVNDSTAWDFKWNADAGSYQLNDGSLTQPSALVATGVGTAVSAVAVGATTQLTVNNTAAVGDTVCLAGFTGADAALLNGKTLQVTAATGTTITVAVNSTAKVITSTTAFAYFPNTAINTIAAYTYGSFYQVDSLTQAPQELFLRFEGLNTAETINGKFAPVIVEIFRFASDPLKELALISDTFGEFQLEGAVLADPLRASGTSKYFNVRKLN